MHAPNASPLPSSTSASGALVRREWRAPDVSGGTVIVPAWQDAATVAQETAQGWRRFEGSLGGMSWSAWRRWCREACLAAAVEYSEREFGTQESVTSTGPLIVGGHQPELFHPGVWAKNFAVGRLAQRVGGTGLQLVVDNDASSRSTILVPEGSREHPSRAAIPFDAPRPMQPWEGVRIADADLFRSFGDRVATAMSAWGVTPVAQRAWQAAVKRGERDAELSPALTAARVHMERSWGLSNLELPMSQVCELPPFWWFVAAVLERRPDFVAHYNAVLAEYRLLNQVRSRSHPVPELVQQEGWAEAPFWMWRPGDNRRERPFVRIHDGELQLRVRGTIVLRCAAPQRDDVAACATALANLPAEGWRLRTRALTTTLFARLGLADLFVHGLGAAKYDEMTDALMARVFDCPPPTFLTVSATLRLPVGGAWDVTASDIGKLRHRLRDLEFNPQRHFSASDGTAALVSERDLLVRELHPAAGKESHHTRWERRQLYVRLREVNALLAQGLSGERALLQQEVAELEQQLQANRVLRSREYSWLTFPEEQLRSEFERFFPVGG